MSERYLSAQIQRVLATIELMAGREIEGAEPGKLAAELGCSPADMTRVLANLEHAGWAERLTKNQQRWRLHKKPVQVSNTVAHTYATALNSLRIERDNYSLLR